MFHVTPEGNPLKSGVNFYPWSERRYSIGFRLSPYWNGFWLRYASHVGRLYVGNKSFQLRRP